MKLNGNDKKHGSTKNSVFGGEDHELPEELKKQIEAVRRNSGKTAVRKAGGQPAQDKPRTAVKQPAADKKHRPDRGENSSDKRMPANGGAKRGHRALTVITCILVLLAAAVAAYAIWEKPPETAGGGLRYPAGSTDAAYLPETSDLPAPETDADVSVPVRRDDCYTFLLTAMDQVGANTDTIIVGRLDASAGKLDLVNIPRDTLVNVSWGVKKVNTVLVAEGGDPQKFIERLSDILGFEVDCYAVVDIKAVEKLVDCIGGVYYDVPRDMDYDDPSQDFYVHIQKGYQWLSGEDAVKVLRFRMGNNGSGYANGDLGRIATQQDFLMSIASQMLTVGNIPNLASAIEIFEEYVKTDLTSGNLAYFARQFLLMDKSNISFSTLPGTGASIRGGSYYVTDIDGWLTLINEKLNPYDKDIEADNLDILQIDANGSVYSTGGEIAGGPNSFFDFYSYKG